MVDSAIFIGVGSYFSLPKIESPYTSTHRLEAALATPGISDYTTSLIIDPSSTELANQLESSLTTAQAGDSILVYFTGHGLVSESDGLHLAGVDSDANDIDLTSYSVRRLSQLLTKSAASSVLVVLDCWSNEDSVSNARITTDSANAISPASVDPMHQRAAITSLTDIKDDHSDSEGSLFARSLLEALSGVADMNQDGVIDAEEVFRFSSFRMKETSSRQQVSYAITGGSGPPVLAQVPGMTVDRLTIPGIFIAAAGGILAATKILNLTEEHLKGTDRSKSLGKDVENIVKVVTTAAEVWDKKMIAGWLRSHNEFLGGARPIDVLVINGPGEVIAALEAIAAGVYS
ncbi:caspase family protein [Saccharothrix saharensis]|uniref:caspase family protein n=1 Tax=Saccharothrix saharensis TaxID=571190 RepID=UPI0036A914B1